MDLEKKIDELQELVSKYESESFAGFFAYFIRNQPDPMAKIDLNKFRSKLKDFLYLIALNFFSGKQGSIKFELSENEIGKIADKLNVITSFYYQKEITGYTKENVVHEIAYRNHFDNGVLSYVEQDLEKLRTVFMPFQDKIIEDFGFDLDFLIGICKELEFIAMIRTTKARDFFYQKEFSDFRKRIEKQKMSFSESFDLLPEKIQDAFHSFNSKPFACQIFKAEDLYGRMEREKVDKFLGLFSCRPYHNPKIRYYSAENPFELTPILKFSDTDYLNLYGKQIPISIYKRLYTHLAEEKSTKNKIRRYREKVLERKVAELFRRFFPPRETFFFENYYIEKNFEQDLLILFKGVAIIVETKASRLREPFRNTEKAIIRLKDDFKISIQYGFDQCKRVEDFFFEDRSFDIKDEKGKVLYNVSPERIHSVYSIVVTLERFGGLQTDLSLLLKKEDEIDYPWSVYIDDLETFLLALKQNFSNPTGKFLNFLNLRREFHGRMYAIDELDICSIFLKNPEKFRRLAVAKDTFLNFSPYEQAYFDELYWGNRLRFTEKPLPDAFYKFRITMDGKWSKDFSRKQKK